MNYLANDLVLARPPGARQVGEIDRRFALLDMLAGGRLAMCDPAHDPAGRFARDSLQVLGFWESISARIAIAEGSPGAARLLDAGEVHAATCFATDLHGDARAVLVGRFPADSHAPIVYPIALTQRARPRAPDVFAFLRSARATKVFRTFGYQVTA